MGAGTIHHRAADLRQDHPVQRVRIAGAPEVLHRRTGFFHALADLAHEGALPHARAALKHHQIVCILQIHHFREEILKSLATVRTHKKVRHVCHLIASKSFYTFSLWRKQHP